MRDLGSASTCSLQAARKTIPGWGYDDTRRVGDDRRPENDFIYIAFLALTDMRSDDSVTVNVV
jgi:hypothetical protein